MHPRVEQLPQPDPDYRQFLRVVRRQRPDRVPLIELAVHPAVVHALLDEAPAVLDDPRAELCAAIRRSIYQH